MKSLALTLVALLGMLTVAQATADKTAAPKSEEAQILEVSENAENPAEPKGPKAE